jgi:hypothetical protein
MHMPGICQSLKLPPHMRSSNLVSREDAIILNNFIKSSSRQEFLDVNGAAVCCFKRRILKSQFFTALLGLYTKISKPETVQYLITLFDDSTQVRETDSTRYLQMTSTPPACSLHVLILIFHFLLPDHHQYPPHTHTYTLTHRRPKT